MLGSSFSSNFSEKFGIRLILAALIVSVFLLYSPVIYFDFINYDDPAYVTQNTWVQAGLTPKGVAWAFGNLHGEQTYWHPITWLSHMLDCQLFGLNAGWHHLVNVLFHALNAGLLFLVLKRLTGAVWRSAIVAALFALHPLQVDTVAWITERKNLLTTLFGLLTLWAYASYVEKPSLKRYLPLLLWFALCLMCKPALAPLPCALLLLDYWPLKRWGGNSEFRIPNSAFDGFALRTPHSEFSDSAIRNPQSAFPEFRLLTSTATKLVLEKVPLLVLSLAISMVIIVGHRNLGSSIALPLTLRLENAVVSYASYLGKLFCPINLAVFYPYPDQIAITAVLFSILLLLLITGMVVWQFKQSPYLAVGWFWFLGLLVPAIGVVQAGMQAMADRFAYVPLIGVAIGIVWGGGGWITAHRWPLWGRLTLGIVPILACTALASRQLGYWKNSLTLWEHTFMVTRKNWVSHTNYGHALHHMGQLAAAKQQFLEASRILPEDYESLNNFGMISETMGELDSAVDYYRKSLQAQSNAKTQKRLSRVLFRLGRVPEAIESNRTALQMLPRDVTLHHVQAQLLGMTHDYGGALPHYRAALENNPTNPPVLSDLAWFLATCPQTDLRNGTEAVRLAEKAVTLTGFKQTVIVGTLAAAYAEAGQFSNAVATAEKAIALARTRGETTLAETNQLLLQTYRQNQAYHQNPE
ncbi:MAG: glycosyltransferase family 39 protein [Verrucomicrobiota bacterium]